MKLTYNKEDDAWKLGTLISTFCNFANFDESENVWFFSSSFVSNGTGGKEKKSFGSWKARCSAVHAVLILLGAFCLCLLWRTALAIFSTKKLNIYSYNGSSVKHWTWEFFWMFGNLERLLFLGGSVSENASKVQCLKSHQFIIQTFQKLGGGSRGQFYITIVYQY